MTWYPPLYMSSFSSLALCLLGSVPSPLITISWSGSVLCLTPVCEARFFWITVAAEVVPEDWSHWSYPSTDQLDECCFHTSCPADILACPTPQAFLCNRSILALFKEFSFIVFAMQTRNTARMLLYFFLWLLFLNLAWNKSCLLTLTYPAWNDKSYLCEV